MSDPLGLKVFALHAGVYVHFDKLLKNNTFDAYCGDFFGTYFGSADIGRLISSWRNFQNMKVYRFFRRMETGW